MIIQGFLSDSQRQVLAKFDSDVAEYGGALGLPFHRCIAAPFDHFDVVAVCCPFCRAQDECFWVDAGVELRLEPLFGHMDRVHFTQVGDGGSVLDIYV
jgi:hypothetical protein